MATSNQTSSLRPDTILMRSSNLKPDTSRISDRLTPPEIESLQQDEYIKAILRERRKAVGAF